MRRTACSETAAPKVCRPADDGRNRVDHQLSSVDELEVDADGDFETIMSADQHEENWLKIAGDHPTLTVRHFFYDWDTEVPSALQIERVGAKVEPKNRSVELTSR